MATYQFSTLADGQTISFNPNADLLFFDESDIAAARVTAFTEGAVLRISIPSFGSHSSKTIFLSNVSAPQLATSNIAFADGSRLMFGDNTAGTANDNAANSLVGTAGDDRLKGFGGADTLNGGAGNDVYEVSTGDVVVDSGGIETVMSDVSWNLGAGLENLELTGTGNISGQGNSLSNLMLGNSGSNYFNGRGGSDTILGGAGNDTIDMSTGGTPQQGFDSIDGGSGIDTLDYDGYARSAVYADLFNGRVQGGGDAGEGEALISSIERFVGGGFDDQIGGSAASEYLDGRAGNDTLLGRDGNDTLIGGAGNDSLYFVSTPGAATADQVVGFASGSDALMLSATFHSGIGANGRFAASDARFWSSTTGAAHDASDRVIYNTSTGQLWYDADGNAAGAAQLIATLQGAPTLLATDVEVVNGPPAGTVVNGTSGNDSLTGTAGNDSINGLGGNDTIRGVDGSDTLVGGDGNDYLEGQGDSASHGGNPGADLLIGGAGDDTLDGALSETQFEAFTADTLDGGLGNDVFHVDGGGDTLIDAGGVDTVVVHQLNGWTLNDGYENLQLFDSEGQSSMFGIGNAANNVIEAVAVRHARLEGLAGNDLLIGTSSEDTLLGGDGNDTIRGLENGFDSIDGGAGDDLISGVGNVTGGAGNDTLNGGIDGGTLAGGTGLDIFVYDQALPFSINPFSIGDFASGSDTIRLDALALPALGASGRMAAGDGRFYAAPGATAGHDADDRVVFNTTTQELFYDADGSGSQAAGRLFTLQPGATLAATDIEIINGSAPSGGTINGTAGNDSLVGTSGNDTINGLAGNDTLSGLAGADRLDGGAGSDSMLGGDGNDTLLGQAGIDRLTGGAGNDAFVFNTLGSENRDIVQDFASGLDKLQMEDAVMTAIGAAGNFAVGDARFWAAAGATAGHDANDRIIYNSSNGDLYYDADGSGSAAARILGNLSGHPVLAATDIAVI